MDLFIRGKQRIGEYGNEDFRAIYHQVKLLIDAMDSCSLLAMGCPKDEFDEESESAAIRIYVSKKSDPTFLAETIAEVFTMSFDDDLTPRQFQKEANVLSERLVFSCVAVR